MMNRSYFPNVPSLHEVAVLVRDFTSDSFKGLTAPYQTEEVLSSGRLVPVTVQGHTAFEIKDDTLIISYRTNNTDKPYDDRGHKAWSVIRRDDLVSLVLYFAKPEEDEEDGEEDKIDMILRARRKNDRNIAQCSPICSFEFDNPKPIRALLVAIERELGISFEEAHWKENK